MKKTLTVNLGGTVFHIDEDAYRLLDNYLCNLRLHFRKQEGAEEIVNDIENRISELFAEKLSAGSQVITIADVEEVIARMGKPEDFGEDTEEEEPQKTTGQTGAQQGATIRRRLYRNPDDKILGGVISGLAAYLNWDVTVLRLIMFVVLICGYGVLIPIYIICWLVIPEARTAAEKLNMRGEDITIENIGRTVTDGFERMANGVNNYVNSGKPRSFLQKVGDALVSIAGFFLKACLVVLAIVFVALVIAAIAVAIGGGAALYQMLPSVDWSPLISTSPMMTIAGSIAGVVLAGIPLAAIIFVILRQIFNWSPMSSGLKWSLLIIWILAVVIFVTNLSYLGWPYPFLWVG